MRIKCMNRRAGRPPFRTLRSGFTLIELMVVVVIIAMLSLVLGKAASMVMGKSAMTDCAAKLRSIGTAVRAYASEWQGMTNPDGDGYPALFGHRVRQDPTYAPNDPTHSDHLACARRRLALTQFVCPLDQNPFVIQSGYRSSYQLASGFIGRNVMAVGSSRSTVLLSEMGKRHKNKGFQSAIYLFADLHFEISGPNPDNPSEEGVMPGLRSRWYNQSSNLTIYASEPRKELVWSDPIVRESRDGLPFLPAEYYDPGQSNPWQNVSDWDESSARNPRRIMGVWDGYIEFPSAGDWRLEFHHEQDDRCSLEIGGTTSTAGPSSGRNRTQVVIRSLALGAELRVPVEFKYLERGTGVGNGFPNSYFRLYWQKTDAPIMPRRPIPPDRMFHLPFEPSNVQN